jgi:hypothetical protein
MISVSNKIINSKLYIPSRESRFEEFCIKYYSDRDGAGARMFKLFSRTDEQELAKFDDHPIFTFYSYSYQSAKKFYTDICDSFTTFNAVLFEIINNEEHIIKQRYKRHYKSSYEKDKLSYDHYLSDNWDKVIKYTFEYFEKDAIGQAINSYNESIQRNIKLNPPSVYKDFGKPIPFVDDENSTIFIEEKKTKLLDNTRVANERLRMLLRIASICKAHSFYYKFLATQKNIEVNYLKAEIFNEKVEKWLYAAEIQRQDININLSEYYSKKITQQVSAKQPKEKEAHTRKEIQTKLNELAKKCCYDGMSLKEIYKHIRRNKSHTIKILKNDNSNNYLTNKTIKLHISKIITTLG